MREDVTPVPSQVMEAKVSTHDANSRGPGLMIFLLYGYNKGTNSSSLRASTFIFICFNVCISRAEGCGLVAVFISLLSAEAAWRTSKALN